MIEGKIWGETESIFNSESVGVHFLRIKQGGYSSKHRHLFKANGFHVVRGAVIIREWKEGGAVDETTLRAGQGTLVRPLGWHQFEALEDSEMIEIYLSALQSPDIIREGQGGVKCVAEIKNKKKHSE
jgi:quercetin dioxygenase-like cupin family protein